MMQRDQRTAWGRLMEAIPDGWEIVSRHGNYDTWFVIWVTFILTFTPPDPLTITITVREKATGRMYSITGANERDAIAKLGERSFD